MKHTHTLLLLLLTLVSCTDNRQPVRDGLDLTGAWMLRHVAYPQGGEQHYSMQGDGTSCLIYDREGGAREWDDFSCYHNHFRRARMTKLCIFAHFRKI